MRTEKGFVALTKSESDSYGSICRSLPGLVLFRTKEEAIEAFCAPVVSGHGAYQVVHSRAGEEYRVIEVSIQEVASGEVPEDNEEEV